MSTYIKCPSCGRLLADKELIFQEKMAEINSRLDLLTPAIINDASETWGKFTDAWNALYHKAEKIKSKNTLETLTAKIKEL